MTIKSSYIFLFAKKGLSNDDVGGTRGTAFQEIRPGAGFETGDFVKEKLGGDRRTSLCHGGYLNPQIPSFLTQF